MTNELEMIIEDYICTLEQAVKLQKLGITRRSIFGFYAKFYGGFEDPEEYHGIEFATLAMKIKK